MRTSTETTPNFAIRAATADPAVIIRGDRSDKSDKSGRGGRGGRDAEKIEVPQPVLLHQV